MVKQGNPALGETLHALTLTLTDPDRCYVFTLAQ